MKNRKKNEGKRALCAVLTAALVLSAMTAGGIGIGGAVPDEVTRSIEPDSVAPGEDVTVTIAFTTPENFYYLWLRDHVPLSWDVTDMKVNEGPQPFTTEYLTLETMGKVIFAWVDIDSGTQIEVQYTLHVPAGAEEGAYTLAGDIGTGIGEVIATIPEGTVTVSTVPRPDLTVTAITLNCGYIFANESNTANAMIKNTGTVDADAFNVSFDIDGFGGEVRVISGLAAGTSEEVTVTDATSRTTGESVTITVTADCNTEIDESNEANNDNSTEETVVNNGYKNKSFMGMDSLELFQHDEEMYGGVVYNVSGTKNYPFEPAETDTRIHHIDIPADMTVKKARLYVYWYDYWGNPSPGYLANLSVNFSGVTFKTPGKMYTDQKGFGTYNTPKGTYAYDVTTLVTGSGYYNVVVENIDPIHRTTLLGEMLLIVYEDPTETKKIQLWMLEGNDLLMAADATHGGYNYCVSPEEATATIAFPGTIEDLTNKSATLISVVAQGMEPGSDMIFNGAVIKPDAWDTPTEAYPNSKINVESVDVTAALSTGGNNMGFQDTGTTGMQASNAILVVESAPLITKVNVSLLDGENMFGVPLNVCDWTLPTVLAPIDGKYTYVSYYNATTGVMEYFDPLDPVGSTLKALEPGAGYLISMSEDATASFEGTKLIGLERSFKAGDNMFSIPYGVVDETLPAVLTSIEGKYTYVSYYNATSGVMEYFDPLDPVGSTLKALEPGAGYLITMTEDAVFIPDMGS